MSITSTNHTLTLPASHADVGSNVTVTYSEAGKGEPALILHGGGGPFTVAGIANHLAGSMHTITPTHPGWMGTPRPDHLHTVAGLAQAYLALLAELDLHDVVVLGSSIGGWIAAEMALQDTDKRIARLVLVNAAGVHVEGEVIANVFALGPRGLAEHAFHNPDKFYIDPAKAPAEQQAMQRGNMVALHSYAGEPYMHDPRLLAKLTQIRIPALFVWGESDRVVTLAYGQAFASAFANARFVSIPQAGHLPHIEQPEQTFSVIDAFIEGRD